MKQKLCCYFITRQQKTHSEAGYSGAVLRLLLVAKPRQHPSLELRAEEHLTELPQHLTKRLRHLLSAGQQVALILPKPQPET